MKTLLNCSNLFVGGGVAVATSFVADLAKDLNVFKRYDFIVSTRVHENLLSHGFNLLPNKNYKVFDVHGIRGLYATLNSLFSGYSTVFTIFGPFYTFRKFRNNIVGFAQPNIIYPDVSISLCGSLLGSALNLIKYRIQIFFFKRATTLVVEHENIKARLLSSRFKKSRILVVNSCVDNIFMDNTRWDPVAFPLLPPALKLGVISRNYPHKNLSILPFVKSILEDIYGMKCNIFVTLSNEEWDSCSQSFKNSVINIGTLTLSQCPSFYVYLDAIVFPTLLECFSAVPIESSCMDKQLFASDRDFIRSVAPPSTIYFDPLNPEDIARCIYMHFKYNPVGSTGTASNPKNTELYLDSNRRSIEYMELLNE